MWITTSTSTDAVFTAFWKSKNKTCMAIDWDVEKKQRKNIQVVKVKNKSSCQLDMVWPSQPFEIERFFVYKSVWFEVWGRPKGGRFPNLNDLIQHSIICGNCYNLNNKHHFLRIHKWPIGMCERSYYRLKRLYDYHFPFSMIFAMVKCRWTYFIPTTTSIEHQTQSVPTHQSNNGKNAFRFQ